MSKKIVVAGHICLDITPDLSCHGQNKLEDIVIPGRINAAGKVTVSLGGVPGNTGTGMKVLGADVDIVTLVGADPFGEIILSELKKYGLNTEGVVINPDVATSYSVVIAPESVDRSILHYTGSNDVFSSGDVDLDKVRGAELFHFGYPPLMANMFKNCGEEFIRLVKKVHDAGIPVSVDMAMVGKGTDAEKEDWDAMLKAAMPYIDFFVPSVEEICWMLDRDRFGRWQERAAGGDVTYTLDIAEDVRPLADKLLSYGAKVILIKCGAPGVYFRTAGEERLREIGSGLGEQIAKSWADAEHFERSYKVEKVVSGTGAGDTTIAAFLTALTEGYSWQECLQLATATGALCVQTPDAMSGLMPLADIKAKIDAGWEKQVIGSCRGL